MTAAAALAPEVRPWIRRYALGVALLTFVLLVSGSVVTSREAGMAVPDWPRTFGHNMFTYPPSQWVGDIFYEHGHRLIGSIVGILTIALCVSLFVARAPRHLKALGLIALLAVSVQGVLGGLRVTEIDTRLAALHGCFAHAVFALMAVIVALTREPPTTWWRRDPDPRAPGAKKVQTVALVAIGLIYAQIVTGAIARHFETDVSVHALGAVVVIGAVIALVMGVLENTGRLRSTKDGGGFRGDLTGAAMVLGAGVCAQLLLGFLAWRAVASNPRQSATEPPFEVFVTVAHHATGAILLFAATFLAVRLFARPTSPGTVEPAAPTGEAPAATGGPEPQLCVAVGGVSA